MFNQFLSHPDKLYIDHILNMLDSDDSALEQKVKKFHDIAKLKNNFQIYIHDTSKEVKDKNHSLLSGYIFLLNSCFETKEMLFGFLAIISHHKDVENFFALTEDNRYIGKYIANSKELKFLDEVIENAKQLEMYNNIDGKITLLEEKSKRLQKYLRSFKFKNSFDYSDFIDFKKLYSSLVYSDKYEAIFGIKKESKKIIDKKILADYIDNLPFHQKRDNFRKFVLRKFDNKYKLFTLTAPTGYGKTLTSLEFALKFDKEKIIFALPFTSIIDQVEKIISDIFKYSNVNIFKVHHKTTIDENIDKDRYSQVKFLMSSFSGEINITTLYQVVFALFGNKNKDNIKFNQFKNAVIIIDEAQAIPYIFRQDFIKLCELISKKINTVFIFMSATMPIMPDKFQEISNLEYFKKQNRYILKWLRLEKSQESLIEIIRQNIQTKHTLCVVNTIKKSQELYLKFKDDCECYCLNGYMTDNDKQKTIKVVSERLIQNRSKILLVSTQTIEAGVDLDFEVGFREVAPISSIIQTAGRINRHFKDKQGVLYIFEDICGYSDLIYGDMQQISRAIFDILKDEDIQENDISEVSRLYFEKINNQLENFYIKPEIEKLEFFTINQKIEAIMDNKNPKKLIIIEPYDGFIQEIEDKLYQIKKEEKDKFKQKDLVQAKIKKLLKYGVNISERDIKTIATSLNKVRSLYEMIYLPAGAEEYSSKYGFKKYKPDKIEASDIGFDF